MSFSYVGSSPFHCQPSTGLYKLTVLDKEIKKSWYDFYIRNFGIFNPKVALILQNVIYTFSLSKKGRKPPKMFINTTGEVCLIGFDTLFGNDCVVSFGDDIFEKLFSPLKIKECGANVNLKRYLAAELKKFWEKCPALTPTSDRKFLVYTHEQNGFTFEGSTEILSENAEDFKDLRTTSSKSDKKTITTIPFTYNEYKVIFDFLMDRPINEMKAEYGEEVVTTILGHSVNPFTMTLVNTLANEIINLHTKYENKIAEIGENYLKKLRDANMEEKGIDMQILCGLEEEKNEQQIRYKTEYNNKIKELQQKIDSLLNVI